MVLLGGSLSKPISTRVDQDIFGLDKPVKKRTQVVEEMVLTLKNSLNGAYLGHITRHMLGLFQNMPGAAVAPFISENAHKPGWGRSG